MPKARVGVCKTDLVERFGSDVMEAMRTFAARSSSAATVVLEVTRAGHLLRIHSAARSCLSHESPGRNGGSGAVRPRPALALDNRTQRLWGEFAEYLACVLTRPPTVNDLEAAGFLVGVSVENRERIISAISDIDQRYQHFQLTAPEAQSYPDLESYFAAHVKYFDNWRKFVGENDIFHPIDPNDPDPITDEDDEYWMRLETYCELIPNVPMEFLPLAGKPLSKAQEVDVINSVFAQIDYPLSAEAEGHEQLARGILQQSGVSCADVSVNALCNIGSLTMDELENASGLNVDAATVIFAGLLQNPSVMARLDLPMSLQIKLHNALSASASPTKEVGLEEL